MIRPDIESLKPDCKPFFEARYAEGSAVASGSLRQALGRRIPLGDGKPDDGVFVEWSWDGTELVVRNDRYGMYPLFYACHDNQIRISPSIQQVLDGNVPRDLDHSALAVLLRLGHCVGDDTPFAHIRTQPANSTMVWRDGTLTITRHADNRAFRGRRQLSFDDAVDAYITLFDQATARRLPHTDRFTVPLSGGRDSRHILLALDKQGVKPPFCPTLQYRPPATNEDMRIAGLLTSRMGIEHVQVARPQSWFDAVLKDVHLTNYCGGGHSWSLPLAAYLKGRVDTMYDGLAGSVLSGGFMLDEGRLALVRAGKFEELAVKLVSDSGKEGYNNTVLKSGFLRLASREAAVARLAEELAKHTQADNPLLSFIFWNRTRRAVGSIPYEIMSDVPTVHCPYLDHDVFDFLTSIDPEMFLDNKLHDAAIKRGYPTYTDIPFEDKALKAAMDADARTFYRQSIKRFARYLAGRGLRGSSIVRTSYLYPRVIFDLMKRRNALPWYLMSSVHALELEEVRRSG